MIWLIILSAAVMLGLALFMTWVLGWANQAMHVEVDPRIEQVDEALPGANCGGCGYVGCGEYAEAVVINGAAPNLCPVGGAALAEDIANILGLELEESYPYRPAIHCAAHCDDKLGKHQYRGEATCATANLVAGVQGCTYGCLAMGDCVESCNFDAIHLVDGKIEVDYDACVGCGACAKVCPRNVISMVPFKAKQMFVVACSNQDKGKDVKAVCKVGCIGCSLCKKLSGGLFDMEGNKPTISYDEYDPETIEDVMNTVLEKCPAKMLIEIGTPTEADLQATEGEEMPQVVEAHFETTVDDTEWHG